MEPQGGYVGLKWSSGGSTGYLVLEMVFIDWNERLSVERDRLYKETKGQGTHR